MSGGRVRLRETTVFMRYRKTRSMTSLALPILNMASASGFVFDGGEKVCI